MRAGRCVLPSVLSLLLIMTRENLLGTQIFFES